MNKLIVQFPFLFQPFFQPLGVDLGIHSTLSQIIFPGNTDVFVLKFHLYPNIKIHFALFSDRLEKEF